MKQKNFQSFSFLKWTLLLALFISSSQAFAQTDKTYTFDIEQMPKNDYSPTNVPQDLEEMSAFFGITTSEFSDLFEIDGTGEIVYGAIEPDDNFNTASTANAPGHWFDANGYAVDYGSGNGRLYSELDIADFSFNIGQYPDLSAIGDTYTIKQALTYTPSGGEEKRIVFTFNLSVVEFLSTNDVPEVNSIRIWKNSNHLYVNKLPVNSTIKIYDMLGKTLLNEKIQGDSFDVELSSGIKILSINDSFVKKISL